MRKYLLLLILSAFGLLSCSRDVDTEQVDKNEKKYISFAIALPGGASTTYTRAEIQTSREKEVAQLDVYMFNGVSGLLEAVYNDVSLTSATVGYTATIQVDGTEGRDFLFVANNVRGSATEIVLPAVIGETTLSEMKASTTLAIAASDAYIEPPLLMTAELEDVVPEANDAEDVLLVRVMARFDIRNREEVLTLTGFEFLNTYDKASLFGTGYPAAVQEMSFAKRALPSAANAETSLIQYVQETDHKHFKHVIYTYPAPATLTSDGPTIVLYGTLKTADGDANVSYTIPLKPKNSTDYIEVKRNYCYTLEISAAISNQLSTRLIASGWDNDEEVVFVFHSDQPVVSYDVPENNATYANKVLTVDNTAFTYALAVDYKSTDWVLSHGKQGAATDTNFDNLDWVSVASDKSDGSLEICDKLLLTLSANATAKDREVFIRVACKADPHKFVEFKIVQGA